MLYEGNIYINGVLMEPDENNNIIVPFHDKKLVLESADRIQFRFENGDVKVYNTVAGNPVYLNLYDICSPYFYKDYSDEQIGKEYPFFVQKSSYYVEVETGGNVVNLVLLQASDSKIMDFCDSNFYGGEEDDIYIYYFAVDGEPPEAIEVDDPTKEQVEVYACDCLGPKIDAKGTVIDNSSTQSLDDGIGATFFCEENVDENRTPYPVSTLTGNAVYLAEPEYPHTMVRVTSYAFCSMNEPWTPVDTSKEIYKHSPFLYYDRLNTDFSDYIGYYLYSSPTNTNTRGWYAKIVDAFAVETPLYGQTIQGFATPRKNMVVTDKPIFANFGILQKSEDGQDFRPEYLYERWRSASGWTIYINGKTDLEAIKFARKFLVAPMNQSNYTPESQQIWVFDVEQGLKFKLTLTVNNVDYGTATGSGEYEFGENVTISAIANEGYEFSGWSDGNQDNPRQITVVGDMQLSANFIEATPSPIPRTYQLVEWIKGTGNPRISTSIKDNNISKIEAMWRCSQTATTGTGWTWTGTLQSSPSVRCGWGIRNSNGHLEAWWGSWANTSAEFGEYDKTDTELKKMVIDVTNKNASFNGGTPVALGNGTLATTGQNFYLFVDSNSSTLPSTQYFGNVKIYNMQGNLVRDLYPVRRKSDDVGMMFDLVSNEPFANIFVGQFEVGPDKQWEE